MENLFMPAPELEDFEGSISNSRSDLLLQIRKELPIMLRKALTLGMVFIFALSLLAVSMITCFTYDAEAHWDNPHSDPHWDCYNEKGKFHGTFHHKLGAPFTCYWWTM